MTPPRLTARFWVDAYLTRLRLADIPAFVTARGDATAGAVVVKLNRLDGTAAAFLPAGYATSAMKRTTSCGPICIRVWLLSASMPRVRRSPIGGL